MKLLRSLVLFGTFVLLVTGGAAWFVGGQRTPGVDAGQALAGVDANLPAAGARVLSTDDVRRLRAAGWTCPDLSTAGYWLESAELTDRAGAPAVVANLRSSAHAVTIVEQHPGGKGTGRAATADGTAIRDGLTGVAVSAAAFDRSERDGTEFWVARSSRGAASDVVFRVGDAVYSLQADAAIDDAMRVATVIATADKARVADPRPADDDAVLDRLSRGLGRLLGGGS